MEILSSAAQFEAVIPWVPIAPHPTSNIFMCARRLLVFMADRFLIGTRILLPQASSSIHSHRNYKGTRKWKAFNLGMTSG
jgi:hypothetical protein